MSRLILALYLTALTGGVPACSGATQKVAATKPAAPTPTDTNSEPPELDPLAELEKAKALILQNTDEELEYSMPIKSYYHTFVVRTRLNQVQDVYMIIDTGAAQSFINMQIAPQIGLRTSGYSSTQVNTSHGPITFSQALLTHIGIGKYQLNNVIVLSGDLFETNVIWHITRDIPERERTSDRFKRAVLNVDGLAVGGIVGLDVLERFNYSIDTIQKRLYLEKR